MSSSVMPSPSLQMARSLDVGLEDLANMSAFDLFRRQMESQSAEAALDAMKRVSIVAIHMGQDEAKEKLVPFLQQIALKQPPHPDELLLTLGQELVTIANLVGPPELFLPTLERLAATEETVVRDQAVAVINQIVRDAKEPTAWVALAKRLAAADWFTPKVSVCGILPDILQLQTNQVELLALYKDLCADETPMVRRAAAKHIGRVLKVVGFAQREFGVATLPALCRDEQDSIRLLAVSSLADIGDSFAQNPQWTCQHWLPIVKEGTTDMSWRVRNNLAKNFSTVVSTLGISGDKKFLNEQSLVMACFVSLLTDMEAEVRAAAVAHLARMIAWGGQAHFVAHLQPLLPALADDVVMEVRSKCALALMDAAHDGALEDSVVLQAFAPLLENFLQDEFHEVQLQVLTNLNRISHLLPGLSGVVTSLLQMSKATNWRVRQAVAAILPHLADARGLDFFSSVLLEPAWLTLLLDPVASVRESIVAGMPLLVKTVGAEWIQTSLLPHHVRIYNQNVSNYLVRITILHAHIKTAVACKDGPLWNDVVLQILRGLADKVANVRMVAAEGLARVVVDGDIAVVQAQIRPALEKRAQEDEDLDCRHACQIALDKVK